MLRISLTKNQSVIPKGKWDTLITSLLLDPPIEKPNKSPVSIVANNVLINASMMTTYINEVNGSPISRCRNY